MKRKIMNLILVFTLLVGFTACKKGENDPFLSLKSRDARISGTWEMSSLEYTKIEKGGYGGTVITETYTKKFDGDLMTVINDGDVYTYSYKYIMTINKDGTYEIEETRDGNRDKSTGHWWWLNDSKRKTRIAFEDDLDSYGVDMLKSKELVFKNTSYYKDVDSDGEFDELDINEVLTFVKTK